MLPYIEQPRVSIGPFTLHAFSVLVAIAILAGRAIIVRRAPRFGIKPEMASRLVLVMLLTGFAGAMVDRAIVSGIPGIASWGGLGAGLLGGLWWCRRQRLTSRETFRLLDIICYALPFAFVFGRLGCALAHDHRGFASTGWLAVRFPEGSRYDLGLIEFLFLLVLGAAFVYLDRRPRSIGFFLGLYGVVYGSFRLWLDTLHMVPLRFVGGIIAIVIGLAGWLSARRV